MSLLEIRYPVMTRRGLQEEVLRVLGPSQRRVYSERSGGIRVVSVDLRTLREDVERSESGELLAAKLLTPFSSSGDQSSLRELLVSYGMRMVIEGVSDLLRDFRGMAHRLRFGPEYLVMRKVGALTSIYPPLWRVFWWASDEHHDASALERVIGNLAPALELAVEEGIVARDASSGSLRIPAPVSALRFGPVSKATGFLAGRLQSFLRASASGIALPRIVLEELTEGGWEGLGMRSPESLLTVVTDLGPARVDDDSDVVDLITRTLRVERSNVRVSRIGKAFNSTYLIEVEADGERRSLFLKRYLAWNSVKWVAAKLWAFPLRNFHVSPSMRLSNELFFMDYLRERTIPTPRVIHVSWRRKLMVRQAVRGSSAMEVWTSNRFSDSEAERVARECGRLIARVHREGVVVGDCKADNVVVDESGRLWLVDLEQASLSGDRSWDVAEFALFACRYLEPSMAERFAESFAGGYLELGDEGVVRRALDPKYVLVMMPWSPIWTQMAAIDGLRRALKA
ncbi:MAG: lipopolysaccharide kinase InaA family protein [Nitrososphaerota archaeon]